MSPELIENVRSSHESLEAVLRPAYKQPEDKANRNVMQYSTTKSLKR